MKPHLLTLGLIALGAFALYEILTSTSGQSTQLLPSTSTTPTGSLNLGLNVSSFQPVSSNASGLYQAPALPLQTVSGQLAAPISSPPASVFGGDFGL